MELFKKLVDVVLRDTGTQGHSGLDTVRLMAVLSDPRGLFQTKLFFDFQSRCLIWYFHLQTENNSIIKTEV